MKKGDRKNLLAVLSCDFVMGFSTVFFPLNSTRIHHLAVESPENVFPDNFLKKPDKRFVPVLLSWPPCQDRFA